MSFIEWKDLFDDIFEAYPDEWTLNFSHRNNTSQHQLLKNKRMMKHNGYARFHCSKCSNNWASAKAMVLLYYPNDNEPLGKITLRFLGQQCKKCSRNNFADPEFDDESIKLILEKLYQRIGWFCYDEEKPPKKQNENSKNKNINGPHESNLCEACRLGICDQILTEPKRKTQTKP